ncbi:MAG: hypothetical protein WCI65_04785, partial [Synechococcaceae cyanobacterium ELA263]
GVFQIKVIQHLLPSDPPLERLLGFPRSPKDYHPIPGSRKFQPRRDIAAVMGSKQAPGPLGPEREAGLIKL